MKYEPLVSVELTREELEGMEEGERCSSGLMCAGLRLGNYPAFVGWYLEADRDTGHDVPRHAYGWTFKGDPLGGAYCEDCVLEIERLDKEYRERTS